MEYGLISVTKINDNEFHEKKITSLSGLKNDTYIV